MRRGRSSERAIRSVPTDAPRGRSSATTGTPVGGGDIGTGGACETGGTGGGGGGGAAGGVLRARGDRVLVVMGLVKVLLHARQHKNFVVGGEAEEDSE